MPNMPAYKLARPLFAALGVTCSVGVLRHMRFVRKLTFFKRRLGSPHLYDRS